MAVDGAEVNTRRELAEIHLLAQAGMGRNVGFAANKVFAGPLLEALGASHPVIGVILGMEGLFGVLLSPLTGWASDRTSAAWLRRRIYVLVGLPVAAAAWVAFCMAHSQVLAVSGLMVFYIFENSMTSPYQAWMPDIVAKRNWGLASGYLNAWWLFGNLLSFLAIPLLWKATHTGAYLATGLIMAGSGLVTGLAVHDRVSPGIADGPGETATRGAMRRLLRGDMLLFLVAQACAWLSFEGAASFFTLFMVTTVHGTVLDAALAMALFSVFGVVAAAAAGKLYHRFSSRSALIWSMGAYAVISLLGYLAHAVWFIMLFMPITGALWGAVQTVSFAYAVQLLDRTLPGEGENWRATLYGLMNVAQSAGLLLAAPFVGLLVQAAGGAYSVMFGVAALAMAAGAVVMARVR